MNYQNEIMGVYTLYRLGRAMGNIFDVNVRYLDRDFHVVPNAFAEDTNRFSTVNGLLYVKDALATEKYFKKEPFSAKTEYTAFEEVKTVVTETTTVKKADEVWADPISVIEEVKPVTEVIVNKPAVLKPLKKEDIAESIEELRATFTELSGKKHQPMWGKVQLVKEISKLNKD